MSLTSNSSHTQPVFVLCIGASKSGTTWFHRYLDSFDCVDSGFKKEYHVFDTVYLDHSEHFLPRQTADRHQSLGAFREKQAIQEAKLRSFRENHDNYFDYFASLYADGITLSADITPNYMRLPSHVLSMIQSEFRQRGIQTRIVFFMRDPVSRLISIAKMAKRLGKYAGCRFDRNDDLNAILGRLCELPNVMRNLNYRDTLIGLDRVCNQDDLHIGIYETMFSEEGLQELSSSLGLYAKSEWLNMYYNQSSACGDEVLPDIFSNTIRQILSEQYAYCFQRMPELAANEIWSKHSRMLTASLGKGGE